MARARDIEITQAIFQSIKDPSLRHKLIGELVKSGGGISIVGSTGSAATAAGGAASGLDAATRLAIALGDLDTHEDGDVITADSYNALVEALRALAGFATGDVVASGLALEGVETFAPMLLPSFRLERGGDFVSVPGWGFSPEFAQASDDAVGWMPVTLPDGVLIDELRVFSERDDGATMEVALRRLSLDDPMDGGTVLCRIRRGGKAAGDDQPDTARVRVSGIPEGPALDALRTVDNSAFRYVIDARAFSTIVRVFTLQVSWVR